MLAISGLGVLREVGGRALLRGGGLLWVLGMRSMVLYYSRAMFRRRVEHQLCRQR